MGAVAEANLISEIKMKFVKERLSMKTTSKIHWKSSKSHSL